VPGQIIAKLTNKKLGCCFEIGIDNLAGMAKSCSLTVLKSINSLSALHQVE